MKIEDQRIVSIHYTLTSDGVELDSSSDKPPLSYLHGSGHIIPGLEKALDGLSVGDDLKVEIQPADAYGELNEALIQQVPKSAFEGAEKVEPGMQFHAAGQDGSTQNITVVAVEGEEVTINANHPLAGKVLEFDVSVEEVRVATPEELAQAQNSQQG